MRDRIKKYLQVYFIWPVLSEITNYVIDSYSEPWREYHSINHLEKLFDTIEDNPVIFNNKELLNQLIMVTIFHDIVYKPWRKDNEEKSALVFKKLWTKYSKKSEQAVENSIYNCIIQTKNHNGSNHFERVFNSLDMAIISGTKEEVIEWEKEISKEYSFVPYNVYKKHRIEFLEKFSEYPNITKLIEIVRKSDRINNPTLYFTRNYTKYYLHKVKNFLLF